MLETANKDTHFPKKFITEDESLVHGYDTKTKTQSSQWKSPEFPRLKKARPNRINVKAMLTVFLIINVYHVYAPAGQTATKEYYIEVLRRLTDAVEIKRLQFIDYLH